MGDYESLTAADRMERNLLFTAWLKRDGVAEQAAR